MRDKEILSVPSIYEAGLYLDYRACVSTGESLDSNATGTTLLHNFVLHP